MWYKGMSAKQEHPDSFGTRLKARGSGARARALVLLGCLERLPLLADLELAWCLAQLEMGCNADMCLERIQLLQTRGMRASTAIHFDLLSPLRWNTRGFSFAFISLQHFAFLLPAGVFCNQPTSHSTGCSFTTIVSGMTSHSPWSCVTSLAEKESWAQACGIFVWDPCTHDLDADGSCCADGSQVYVC